METFIADKPLKQNSEAYEALHVHKVYNQIASHFSSTRYKPWPIVEQFLQSLPPGSVGLDVGCGNGKYLSVNPDVYIIASDRSENLIQIANDQHKIRSTALVADSLSLPHQQSRFDFAISIAVVHHLSTSQRRIEAIAAILSFLRPCTTTAFGDEGKALIFVWALEQKSSRRGWDEGMDQDVMVPWVMKQGGQEEKTFKRYYHLYKNGELEADVAAAGGRVMESGWEKDNWWAIAVREISGAAESGDTSQSRIVPEYSGVV